MERDFEFHPEIALTQGSAEAIARGLFAVAKVDGIHEREAALISSFWIDLGRGAGALADLERSATIKPLELAAALPGSAERTLFVKTALLLSWADGKVSANERKLVGEFAAALAIEKPRVDALEGQVKEFLLGHLTHLHNTDATQSVAHKLKV